MNSGVSRQDLPVPGQQTTFIFHRLGPSFLKAVISVLHFYFEGMAVAASCKRTRSPGTPRAVSTEPPAEVEARIRSFVAKFEPGIAGRISGCRAALRALFPTAFELVYDNYNFFVIGYSPTERPSDTVVSLAAAANGIGLSFYRGATLPDPEGLLLGSGTQNRFVRLPAVEVLSSAPIRALIRAAVVQAKVPFPPSGGGRAVIRSVSAKQRPRRKTNAA